MVYKNIHIADKHFYRYKDLFAEGGEKALKGMNRHIPNIMNYLPVS